MFSVNLSAAWWMLAQNVPEASPTTLLVGVFAGYGITGVLSYMFVRNANSDRETARSVLSQVVPLLTEIRDVMRDTTEAHHAAVIAAKAGSDALERFGDRIPTPRELERIRILLERWEAK